MQSAFTVAAAFIVIAGDTSRFLRFIAAPGALEHKSRNVATGTKKCIEIHLHTAAPVSK